MKNIIHLCLCVLFVGITSLQAQTTITVNKNSNSLDITEVTYQVFDPSEPAGYRFYTQTSSGSGTNPLPNNVAVNIFSLEINSLTASQAPDLTFPAVSNYNSNIGNLGTAAGNISIVTPTSIVEHHDGVTTNTPGLDSPPYFSSFEQVVSISDLRSYIDVDSGSLVSAEPLADILFASPVENDDVVIISERDGNSPTTLIPLDVNGNVIVGAATVEIAGATKPNLYEWNTVIQNQPDPNGNQAQWIIAFEADLFYNSGAVAANTIYGYRIEEEGDGKVLLFKRAVDIGVTKTVESAASTVAQIGDTVTFDITVENFGPGDTTNVIVEDILPAGLTYVSDNGAPGEYDSVTGVWDAGDLTNGSTNTIQIDAQVTGVAAPFVTNEANVVSDFPDIVLSNDTASATVFVDSDGDGEQDSTDIDSDNDGILNGDESSCAEVDAYWPLDNSTIDVENGNNAQGVVTTAFSTESIQGTHSASFSGSSQITYSRTASFMEVAATQISFSAWIQPSNTTGAKVIFDEGGSGNGYTVWQDGNQIKLSVRNGGAGSQTNLVSSTTVNAGEWYHIATVFNSGNMTIYVNGNSNSISGIGFTTISGHSDNGGLGAIGSNAAGISGSFVGLIDGVKYSNTAWTSSDIDYNCDADNDGIRNILDLDSDNDGITDIIEAGGVDSDNDGIVDNITDTDGDGWANTFDSDNGGTALSDEDTDGDNIKDRLDLDSDNDGVPDIIEAGGVDSNDDGIVDTATDTDNDGWANTFDSDNGGTALENPDSDGDSIDDRLDLDSDNDGVQDIIEAGGVDTNNDGEVDTFTDGDEDGWANTFDSDNGGTALNNPDTDSDLIDDRIDLDSDNDGIADIIEAGGIDNNNDGVVDGTFTDGDGDGWANTFDSDNGGTALADTNTDTDNVNDRLDLDSDNDGIADIIEAGGVDSDNDGRVDTTTDTDSDGWANTFDSDNGGTALADTDTDSNGTLNRLDLDSDADGCSDANEYYDDINADGGDDEVYGLGSPAVDADGLVTAAGYDGTNYVEVTDDTLSSACDPPDADGDSIADNEDIDIDNDGILNGDETSCADVEAYWPLDNNTNDIENGNNEQETSFSTFSTESIQGTHSANFSGSSTIVYSITSGFMEVAASEISFSAWIQPSNVVGDKVIFDEGGSGSGFTVWQDENELKFTTISGSSNQTTVTSSTTLSSGVWYHIAAIFDNGDMILYVNGVSDTVTSIGFTTISAHTNNGGLGDIGTNAAGVSGSFVGLIDAVKYSNTVWTSSEIDYNCDTDSDGVSNIFDLDSDNDGITDIEEAGGVDSNNDGRVDSITDTDGDGWANTFDSDNGGTALADSDTDGDGYKDRIDLDSDNDGISDIIEADGVDTNNDGVVDVATDTDDDGWANTFDSDDGGTALANEDVDGDGFNNTVDLDSDNDGLTDIIEAGGVDADDDGVVDIATDTDGDGWANTFDSDNGGTVLGDPDTDGDEVNDRVDLDSDNDGIADILEAGGVDNNDDSVVDNANDTDGDGWADTFDPNNFGSVLPDTDSDTDGNPDRLELDSDDDGCSDANEYYEAGDADGGGSDDDEYGDSGSLTVDANGLVDQASYDGTSQGLSDSKDDTVGDACEFIQIISGDWDNPANWRENAVPTENDNATIDDGVTSTVTQNQAVNNLTLNPSSIVEIDDTFTLNVKGDITNNGEFTSSTGTGDGEVVLDGAVNQDLFGDGEYENLRLDNSNGADIISSTVINGVLTIDDGTFTTNDDVTFPCDFDSSNNRVGQIGVVSATGSISGDVITEQCFPARRAFRFISPSTTTASSSLPTIQDNWQEGATSYTDDPTPNSSTTGNFGYGTHITGDDTSTTDNSLNSGFDWQPSGNPSMFTFDEVGQSWNSIGNTDTNTLTAGDPYRLMIRGDRSLDITTNAATPTNTKLRSTGVPSTGDVEFTNIAVGPSDNATLIGNPYHTVVNLQTVLANSSGIQDCVMIWDPTLGGVPTLGQPGGRGAFVTIDLDSGSSCNATSEMDIYLQPYQAFFVFSDNTSSPSVLFTESAKAPREAQVNVFSNGNNPQQFVNILLYDSASFANNETADDGLRFTFSQNETNSIGNGDYLKVNNVDENLATWSENTKLLSMERRALPEVDEVLQLYTTQYRDTDYVLELEVGHFPDNDVYLVDNFSATNVLLNENSTNTYSYVVNPNDLSSAWNRFTIEFEQETLGIDDNEIVNSISVYPNPASDIINVDLNQNLDTLSSLELYDVTGKLVMTRKLENSTSKVAQLDISQFSNGVYMLKITSSSNVYNKKIIIE